MFETSSKTLKTLATVWFVITEIGLIITSIILLFNLGIGWLLYALLIFFLGTLTAGTNFMLMICVSESCANSSKSAYHLDRMIKHIPYIPNDENEELSKELKESDPCRVCVVCGKVSPASEFICPVCGMGLPVITIPYSEALPEKTERRAPAKIMGTIKICEKCGTENSSKTAYCEKCGNKL